MAEAESENAPAAPPTWPGWLAATAACIRFYSRLPVPEMPGESAHATPDFRLLPRALPLAALLIALPAALVTLATGLVGLDDLVVASLGVAVLVFTTGAFHEDGLADSADGLFGGWTPERRLEIMKDSRIGSYGTLAIGLALLLRVSTLAAILDSAGAFAAAATILGAAAWSRVEGIRVVATLPPARTDGASAAVGTPQRAVLPFAYGISAGIGLLLGLAGVLPLAGLVIGIGLSALASGWLMRTAKRLIGGQTGDIAGACQQLSEIAIYLGIALVLGWSGP